MVTDVDIKEKAKIIEKNYNLTHYEVLQRYMFEDKTILINSYNVPTILSEKIETILRRGKFNSRMKDYYDIYLFLNNMKNEIDINILKEAMKNTFTKRDSFDYLNDYEEILISIKNSETINKLWQTYSNKYKYANNIKIGDILDLLLKLIKKIDIKTVTI